MDHLVSLEGIGEHGGECAHGPTTKKQRVRSRATLRGAAGVIDAELPITDASHLEIEKSTLNGKAYGTGGGRTVNSNVVDIMLTWIINRDREPVRSGTDRATKPVLHHRMSAVGGIVLQKSLCTDHQKF